VSVASGLRWLNYFDFDAARGAGLLTPDLDVERLGDDDEEALDRVGRMLDFFAEAGLAPPFLSSAMRSVGPAPYGISDARCVVTSGGPGLRAESIVLTAGGSAASTDGADVTSADGLAAAVPAGAVVDMVPLAEAPRWVAAVVETLAAHGVVSGTVTSNELDDGLTAAVGTASDPAEGTVVVVWFRPDLDTATLEEMARGVVADAPADWRDEAQPAEIRVDSNVVVITGPSRDPVTSASTMSATLHPVVAAGLGLEE
jgi:hypothetical protein